MSALFFRKKPKGFVLPRSLYDAKKSQNRLYSIREELKSYDTPIYTPFKTEESFLVDAPLDENGRREAEKIRSSMSTTIDEAEALVLAKRLGAVLILDQKQLWLGRVAPKLGVKTKYI